MTSPTDPTVRRRSSDDPSATARLRSVSGLVESVSTAYTAAHGHPMEHEGLVSAETARRRWAVGLRVAVVAGCSLALLTGGVVVSQIASTPGEVVALDDADPDHVDETSALGDDGTGASAGGAAGTAGDAGSGAAPGAPAGTGTGAGAAGSTATVLVHVVGQVGAPGVVEVPEGSRVVDAIEAAGGLAAGADSAAVNLARTVVDGEQIYVPVPGELPPPAAEGPSSGGATGPGSTGVPGLVDVNTATVEDLDTLPGIGPALAERIVTWRTENGDFSSVDQLADVSGIGPSVLGKIRDLVTV